MVIGGKLFKSVESDAKVESIDERSWQLQKVLNYWGKF